MYIPLLYGMLLGLLFMLWMTIDVFIYKRRMHGHLKHISWYILISAPVNTDTQYMDFPYGIFFSLFSLLIYVLGGCVCLRVLRNCMLVYVELYHCHSHVCWTICKGKMLYCADFSRQDQWFMMGQNQWKVLEKLFISLLLNQYILPFSYACTG